MKALVIDDMAPNCRVLQHLLWAFGECDTATSARLALTLFQEAWKEGSPYDLICVDIMMPKINGLQLIQVLRKIEDKMGIDERQRACIAVVTSRDDTDTRKLAQNAGSDSFITKPIAKAELAKCLRTMGLLEEGTPSAPRKARDKTAETPEEDPKAAEETKPQGQPEQEDAADAPGKD